MGGIPSARWCLCALNSPLALHLLQVDFRVPRSSLALLQSIYLLLLSMQDNGGKIRKC